MMRNRANLTRTGGKLGKSRFDESGFTTAELLGNAAIGVVALVVIWTALRELGVDVVDYVRTQMFSG